MNRPSLKFKSMMFRGGCAVMIVGVLLHLPMLATAHAMNNRLAGMPADPRMMLGMALIAIGAVAACYGALPGRTPAGRFPRAVHYEAPAATPLNHWHLGLIGVLLIGLIIDVMKPATLGFVLPGLAREYGIPRSTAALLPLAALIGTTVGSLFWGWLADIHGRRAAIVISTILFVSTSICGAMPTFGWNIAMCFLMGSSAGGMLPVVYTLLAEVLPPRHRGWLLVGIGGVGLVGGYLAASVTAHLLEPAFGWRVLWLQGFPTGVLLLSLSRFIPESPQFLAANGLEPDLRELTRKFGLVPASPPNTVGETTGSRSSALTVALVIAGLGWSLVNFGLLLWLPTDLQHRLTPSAASGLLAWSAVLGLPVVIIAAWFYSRVSPIWTLVGAILLTGLGLIGLLFTNAGSASLGMILVTGCLIAGTNGTIATLLPYTAESFSEKVRARVTGLVAGSSKLGGVAVQSVALLGFAPSLGQASLTLAVPTFLSGGLLAWARSRRNQHAPRPRITN